MSAVLSLFTLMPSLWANNGHLMNEIRERFLYQQGCVTWAIGQKPCQAVRIRVKRGAGWSSDYRDEAGVNTLGQTRERDTKYSGQMRWGCGVSGSESHRTEQAESKSRSSGWHPGWELSKRRIGQKIKLSMGNGIPESWTKRKAIQSHIAPCRPKQDMGVHENTYGK